MQHKNDTMLLAARFEGVVNVTYVFQLRIDLRPTAGIVVPFDRRRVVVEVVAIRKKVHLLLLAGGRVQVVCIVNVQLLLEPCGGHARGRKSENEKCQI